MSTKPVAGGTAKSSDGDFIRLWERYGSATEIAKILKIGLRQVCSRRRVIEKRYGIALIAKSKYKQAEVLTRSHEGRIDITLDDGPVIVFGDAHFWPGFKTTAFRALVALIRVIKPKMIVCNGDIFDGASISRFPVTQWMERDKKPTVRDELDACTEALTAIEEAAGPGCILVWALGNHDARYETRLAGTAPEFGGISNFHLKDHFPKWRPCWVVWVNDEIVIQHQYHQGVHATHNNVMKGQVHYITNHLHSAKVTPYTDARGDTKYGVDTGMLADPTGPQFVDYMQGRHANWRSGFAVLTLKDQRLLMPELVTKWDEDHVEFRGHVLHADTMEVV